MSKQLTKNLQYFFGNEANGISNYLDENITESISIPMKDDTESLNLGISFSVIIYELYRVILKQNLNIKNWKKCIFVIYFKI